jgi:hypothetical protein
MKTFISKENLHVWTNTQNHIMVSDENKKRLFQFTKGIDLAINDLYLMGYKETARELNAIKAAF